jgi:hypothetical protein
MEDPSLDVPDVATADPGLAKRTIIMGRLTAAFLAILIALVGTWQGVPSMLAAGVDSFLLLLTVFTWITDKPGMRVIVRTLASAGIGACTLLAAVTLLYVGPHLLLTMSVTIVFVALAAIGGSQAGYF